jgi:hypothetical protein
MATATNVDGIYQGQDLTVEVDIDGEDDLSNATWKAVWCRWLTGALTLTKDDDDITADPDARTLTIDLSSTDTADMVGTYVFQAWRTDTGSKTPASEGEWVFERSLL